MVRILIHHILKIKFNDIFIIDSEFKLKINHPDALLVKT